MSGSSGGRGDSDWSSGQGVGGGADPCRQTRRGPINSPKAAVLAKLTVGSTLDVDVQIGPPPVLVVKDAAGDSAGSLTFLGYLELIDCIQNRGVQYRATIVSIAGGVYEVRVEAI